MLTKFQNHINQNLPFLNGRKLLIATSGGIDSMVLLELCRQSKLDIRVAHCNFKLRGDESDEDEKFVTIQCEKSGVLLFVNHFDTQNLQKNTSYLFRLWHETFATIGLIHF